VPLPPWCYAASLDEKDVYENGELPIGCSGDRWSGYSISSVHEADTGTEERARGNAGFTDITMTMAEKVRKLVEPYVGLPLERDGMTKVISFLLHDNGIPHKVFLSSISVRGKDKFRPHFWIQDTARIRRDCGLPVEDVFQWRQENPRGRVQ